MGQSDRSPISKVIQNALALLITGLPAGLVFIYQPEKFAESYWARFALVLVPAALAALVSSTGPVHLRQFFLSIGKYALLSTGLYSIAVRLALVTDYPFPQYWSEGNRFYDYSTILGGFRYHTPGGGPPFAFTTSGMALPFSLPFVFPTISIRAYRLTYQLMWIIPPMLLGALLFRRLFLDHKARTIWMFASAVFAYAFIEQGPVYPPLVLAALVVVAGIKLRAPFPYIFTLAASLYAHYTRWTWSFAPGAWALLLTLLQVDAEQIRANPMSALKEPALHATAGIAGGLFLPLLLGSDMAATLTNPLPFAARQPLLWYRLLPNNTFPPGVLLAVVWASLPILNVVVYVAKQSEKRFHWLQQIAIILTLSIFFTIGLVASVKIGGGSNLHNLDMYLITLLILFYGCASRMDTALLDEKPTNWRRIFVYLLLALGPASFLLARPMVRDLPPREVTAEALETARIWAQKGEREGAVLFIDHRQLLTFGTIEDVTLVDAYEKKLLMEMAMSGAEAFFSDFYADLAAHRFAVIINEPLFLDMQTGGEGFLEENNAYVRWVSRPLACNYFPVFTSEENRLQILIPRSQPPDNFSNCPVSE